MAAMLVDFSKENHHRDWWTFLLYSLSWEWLKTINYVVVLSFSKHITSTECYVGSPTR